MNLKRLMGRRKVQDVKISENDYSQSKTGMAYKVFRVINGKLYPPMVENPDGNDTPIGVWLEAEEGEFIEIEGVRKVLQRGVNKEDVRNRLANLDNLDEEARKKEIKTLKGKTLAYRPGWHLGDLPRAKQFDRIVGWEVVDEPIDKSLVAREIEKYYTFINSYAKEENVGLIFYVKDIDAYLQLTTDNTPYFPYDFVWAECDYIADIDYQEEAHQAGIGNKNVKYKLLPDVEFDDEGDEYHAISFSYKSSKEKGEEAKIIEFIITFNDDLSDLRVDGYPFADYENQYDSKDSVQQQVANYFLIDNMDLIKSIIESGSKSGKQDVRLFSHVKGDLKHLPTGGSYRYRTNPKPDTVPWVISGAIRVRRLIDDYEVNEILGGNAPERQGGDVTLKELGLK